MHATTHILWGAVVLSLATTTVLPAQRQLSGHLLVEAGASPAARAAFMAGAAASPVEARSRYLVVLRERGQVVRLRVDEPPPVVSFATREAAAARITRAPGIQRVREFGTLPLLFVETDPTSAVRLLDDPNVAAVEQDQWHELRDTRDVRPLDSPAGVQAQSTPWGITAVGAPAVWARGARGQGVKVGLLDSGGDVDHPDLVWAGGYDATGLSPTPTLPTAWDDNVTSCKGHGTHVAGTVGARDNTIGVVGVAPEAQLYAVKVFQTINGSCGAWTSSQINGLNWMRAQGVRIASVSIGGGYNGSYDVAVNTLFDQGLLVVASSGNDNMPYVGCPACFNKAIAVGAITSSKIRASYSNYGRGLHLVAPGSGVSSTMPGGGTGSKSGTSMAAPHVAGIFALLFSQEPDLSMFQAIQRVGGATEDLSVAGWDEVTGYGLARADLAVQPTGTGALVVSSPLALVRVPLVAGAAWYTAQQWVRVNMQGPEGMGTLWFAETTTGVAVLSGNTFNDPLMGTQSVLVLPSSQQFSATTPVGVYHDTLTVRLKSSGAVVHRIPIEVSVAPSGTTALLAVVTPAFQTTSVRADSAPPLGAAQLTLTGTGASAVPWSMTGGRWTTVGSPSGTGSRPLTWTRRTDSLAVGAVHVDTLWVTIAGPQGTLRRSIIDSLHLRQAPPPPLTLVVSPGGASRELPLADAAAVGEMQVVLSGTGAANTPWRATSLTPGLVVDTAEYLGTRVVNYHWTGATAAGRLIGRIRIATTMASDQSMPTAEFVDTLVVLVPPPANNSLLAVDHDSLETRSVPGQSMRSVRDVSVTLLGPASPTARWRVRRFAGAGMVSVSTSWRTGSGNMALTTSHGTQTPAGTYVDTLIVERLDALTQPLHVIHVLRIANALQDRVAFLGPSAVSSYAPDHRLVDPIVRTIGFIVDHPSGASDSSWSVRHAGLGPLEISGNTRSGRGATGAVTYTRSALPPVGGAGGWSVDTLWVLAAGREHAYLDSLQITSTPAIYAGPLAVSHNQGSRYWSTPAGATTRLNARLTVTPTGSGSDTLLWRTRVWPGTSTPHAGTGAGASRGSRSIIVWVELGRPVGVHVDTIHTAMLHDQRVAARTLDTLEVVPAPVAVSLVSTQSPLAAHQEYPDRLPLVAIPLLRVDSTEHPVVPGKGFVFRRTGAAGWRISIADSAAVPPVIEVFLAGQERGDQAEISPRVVLPVYRVPALPSRRGLLEALRAPRGAVAGWADALMDGDGHLTLGEVLRLIPHLSP